MVRNLSDLCLQSIASNRFVQNNFESFEGLPKELLRKLLPYLSPYGLDLLERSGATRGESTSHLWNTLCRNSRRRLFGYQEVDVYNTRDLFCYKKQLFFAVLWLDVLDNIAEKMDMSIADIDLSYFKPMLEFLRLPSSDTTTTCNKGCLNGDKEVSVISMHLFPNMTLADFLLIIGTNIDNLVISLRDLKMIANTPEIFRPLLKEIKKLQIQDLRTTTEGVVSSMLTIFNLLDPQKFQGLVLYSCKFDTFILSSIFQCLFGTKELLNWRIPKVRSDGEGLMEDLKSGGSCKEFTSTRNGFNGEIIRYSHREKDSQLIYVVTENDDYPATQEINNETDDAYQQSLSSSDNSISLSCDSLSSSTSTSSLHTEVSFDEVFSRSPNLNNSLFMESERNNDTEIPMNFAPLPQGGLLQFSEYTKFVLPGLPMSNSIMQYPLVSKLETFELLHCDLSRESYALVCDVLNNFTCLKSFIFNPNTTLTDTLLSDRLIEVLKVHRNTLGHLQFQNTCISFSSLKSLLWHSNNDCQKASSSNAFFSLSELELLDCDIAEFSSVEKDLDDPNNIDDNMTICNSSEQFCWNLDQFTAGLCTCNWSNLKKLDLSFNHWLSNSGIQSLCLALKGNCTLIALLLTDSGIRIDGMRSIFTMATGHPSLQTLDMSGNSYDPQQDTSLENLICNGGLLQLRVGRCFNSAPQGLTPGLCDAFHKNTTLQTLSLSANRLRDDGCQLLSAVLQNPDALQSLTWLDISQNLIHAVAIESLAESIHVSERNFQMLQLSGNFFNHWGLHHLGYLEKLRKRTRVIEAMGISMENADHIAVM